MPRSNRPQEKPAVRSEARIIDANANRAAEGMRTLEDIARFALNNREISEIAKHARHDLARAIAALPIPAGLRTTVRNTPGDVGTNISTPAENQRIDLSSVATAAASRSAQATRTIEEIAKSLGSEAGCFETIRYRIYEIDRLIRSALIPESPQWKLCVLITHSLCAHCPWETVAQAAIAGGADCLQLREKTLPDHELLARARRLVGIARSGPRVSVIINDRPDIAMLSNADGVHVGQGDLSPSDVRAVAGAGIPVGVSTSNIDQAIAARADGASSVGLGPMYPSATKSKPETAGPEYLRAFLSDDQIRALPHLCIGGITAGNAPDLVRAGAEGLAVSSAVCGSKDPEQACRSILSGFDIHSPHGD